MSSILRGVAVAALSVLALAGCDESRVVGTLTTSTTLRIVSPGGNKQVLNAGTYRAAVRAQEKGGQVFISAAGGKEVTFKIPQLSGSSEQTIKISPAALRQEFGLSGRVYGTQVPFDREATRSCVYDTERVYRCDGDRGRDLRGRENCGWEWVEIKGYQRVREQGYASYKNLDINLVNTASQKVGNFRGSYSYGDTITNVSYLSSCIPERHRPYNF